MLRTGTPFLILLGALACSVDATPTDDAGPRHPLGKADAAGSCGDGDSDFCGGQSDGPCWCDELCAGYGDCCSDYEAVCLGEDDSSDGGEESGGDDEMPPSIWDDGLASGTPITSSEATSNFASGSTVAANVGAFTIQQRTRQCNATTGCTPWVYPDDVTLAFQHWRLWIPGPGWSPQKSCFQFLAATYPLATGTMDMFVGSGGAIGLRLSSAITGAVDCPDLLDGSAQCGSWTSTSPALGTPASCFVPNPAGSGNAPEAYPSSVVLYDTTETQGSRVSMPLLVTASYVYGRSTHVGPADDTGVTRETEYALYGSLDGSALPEPPQTPCEPTSCEAQGATCGTVDDGCGSTLQCGSCSYPYSCGDEQTCELPANCNLQPCYAGASVSYTCCSAGQVTCSNGQGCTCYDACF